MTDKTRNTLQQEWICLHNSTEKSEALALMIKLLAVIIFLIAVITQLNSIVIILLLLVLWLQEAIWKTFQSRAEQRLLTVEKAWLENDNDTTLQFYSDWKDTRPGMAGLIIQYLANAIRPTVAYPYLVLIPLAILFGAGF